MKTMTVTKLPRVRPLNGDRNFNNTKISSRKVLSSKKLNSSQSTEAITHTPNTNFPNTGTAFHWFLAASMSLLGLGALIELFNYSRDN